ncbi:hypothetical protein [Sphingomonas sp. Ant20]|uniref:hypothetical protein n=1 Tax=Sphingomonas sp. Ant20 TaxID=104605 RepID=UPI000538550C|nr:hypothetical protein [Sphingomonas sp. Ant20]KHA62804.1 hypothetical protein NI18_20645 [Sphingomonas sp. Ant20]
MTDKDGSNGKDDKGSPVLESVVAFVATWGILVFYLGRKGMIFGWVPAIVIALLFRPILQLSGTSDSAKGCLVFLIAGFGAAIWFYF